LHTGNSKHCSIIIFLFISAFAVRFLFQMLIWGFHSPVVDDGVDYHRLAVHLVDDGSFYGKTGVTARRAPLYPHFIAGVYLVFGQDPDAVRLVQIVVNSLLVVLIYLFGRQVYSDAVGILAGIFAVIYPVFVYLPSRFLTENVFVVLVFLSTWYLISHAQRSFVHYAIGGGLIGLAILTRPALLLAPPFLFLWVLGHSGRLRPALIRTLALTAGMACIMAPWTVRNYLVFDQFIPVTTNSGITLLHDNNVFIREMGWAGPQNRIFRPELIDPAFSEDSVTWQSLNEAEQDKAYFNYAIRWIYHNPGEFLLLLPRKIVSYLHFSQGANTVEVKTRLMDLVNLMSYGLLLPLMLVGFGWTLRHEGREQRLIHYILATFLLGVLIYAGGVRLRLPIEPFLLLFAAYTINSLWERLFSDRPFPLFSFRR